MCAKRAVLPQGNPGSDLDSERLYSHANSKHTQRQVIKLDTGQSQLIREEKQNSLDNDSHGFVASTDSITITVIYGYGPDRELEGNVDQKHAKAGCASVTASK